MFQVGDKVPDKVWTLRVVCINNIYEIYLTLGKTYRVKEVIKTSANREMIYFNVYLSLEDIEFEYNVNLFISIEEDRRRKLEKICLKINRHE